jgi:hypothetical protein
MSYEKEVSFIVLIVSICIFVSGIYIGVNIFNNVLIKYICFSAQFVLSKKGRRLIKYLGYTYYYQMALGANGQKGRWLCSTHNHSTCRAKLHTIDDVIVSVKGGHDHPPPEKSDG